MEPRTRRPRWTLASFSACDTGPSGDDSGDPVGGGTTGGWPALTAIVPLISPGWTEQTKAYVPRLANVQLPLQFDLAPLLGTPVHPGGPGPLVQVTSCGTAVPFVKVTIPPAPTSALDGCQ
jgi:hypothetical protein